jgi:Tfp pilus assembly protein PilN
MVTDILKKRFSWIEALDNLEKAIPSGISLSSIQPSFKEGEVRLAGSARDFAALSRFVDNLERLKVYRRVFLVNQSVRDMDNGKAAIMFNINIEGANDPIAKKP